MTATKKKQSKRYRLRVLAGPGADYKDLCPLNVNDDAKPMLIETDEFVGHLMFRVKGLNQADGYEKGQEEDGLECSGDSQWFNHPYVDSNGASAKNTNLSCFQIVGRFKREWAGDQLFFGSVFDEPFKNLPPFTSVGVKIVQYLDPGIKIDLHSEKPSFLSPLIVAMNKINVQSIQQEQGEKNGYNPSQQSIEWPSSNGEHVVEDTRLLFQDSLIDSTTTLENIDEPSMTTTVDDSKKQSVLKRAKRKDSSPKETIMSSKERQHYFAKPKNLVGQRFKTDQIYSFEFLGAGSFVDWAKFKVKFAGFTIDALKIWDGQPCKFTLRTADSSITFFTLWIEPTPILE